MNQLAKKSQKEFVPTILLCFFLGLFGAHRFYAGKILTGVLQLFTLGGLGIWSLIDLIFIATGKFKDKNGDYITYEKQKVKVVEKTVVKSSLKNSPKKSFKPTAVPLDKVSVDKSFISELKNKTAPEFKTTDHSRFMPQLQAKSPLNAKYEEE